MRASRMKELLERVRVNHKTELHVTGDHAVIGLIDLMHRDLLNPCAQAVLSAEVEHLLGFGDATDIGTGKHLAATNQGAEAQRLLLRR